MPEAVKRSWSTVYDQLLYRAQRQTEIRSKFLQVENTWPEDVVSETCLSLLESSSSKRLATRLDLLRYATTALQRRIHDYARESSRRPQRVWLKASSEGDESSLDPAAPDPYGVIDQLVDMMANLNEEELQIVRFAADDMTLAEIGSNLGLATSTVHERLKKIRRKLEIDPVRLPDEDDVDDERIGNVLRLLKVA